jgi:hypothetical protein
LGERGFKNLMFDAGCMGDEGILRVLLSAGATPEERGRALEGLAYTTREDLIQMLCPADIPQQGLDRALCAAADCGKVGMIERLASLGADVNNTEGRRQNTALHEAARIGSPEVVEYLLNHGARVDIRNGEGKLPLDVARDRGTRTLLKEKAHSR